MTLGELIERLKAEPADKVVEHGFYDPHSYRGYYECLAFVRKERVSVKDMLAAATSAVGETYPGYKGGDFKMGQYTTVYISEYGETGEELTHDGLSWLLSRTVEPTS